MIQTSLKELPREARAAIEAEFDPEERLLWVGRPTSERVRKKAVVPLRVFASVLLGFSAMVAIPVGQALLEARTLLRDEAASTSALLATGAGAAALGVIVLAGVYGAYWLAVIEPRRVRRRADLTAYALTPTRLLRVQCRDRHEPMVESYEPSHPLHTARKPYPDGTADVIIGPRVTNDPAASRQVSSGVFTLEAIKDARAVDRLIRATFDPVA